MLKMPCRVCKKYYCTKKALQENRVRFCSQDCRELYLTVNKKFKEINLTNNLNHSKKREEKINALVDAGLDVKNISNKKLNQIYIKLRRNLNKSIPKTKSRNDRFYKTEVWRKLRFEALMKYGRRCVCCGASPPQVILHVDHIKPRYYYPDLELDINNLQILCESCNVGKGARYEDDFRTNINETNEKKL